MFIDESREAFLINLSEWGVNNAQLYLKDEFSYVSKSLFEEYGYFRKDGSFNLTCFVDLLKQAQEIVEKATTYLGSIQPFFLDEISLPEGKKGVILIVQNKEGKMSIKLPNGR